MTYQFCCVASVLAVVGVDDLIIVGLAGVALSFAARQRRVKNNFLRWHGDAIKDENEQLAEAWRAADPPEEIFIIDREFKPPVFLAPTVRVKQKFRRDPQPWYVRWFC